MALPLQNWFLEAYAKERGTDLLDRFEPVSLHPRDVLYEAGSSPKYVHMVTSGAISIMTCMQDGKLIEGEFVGNEGFPESLMLFGPVKVDRRCVVAIRGSALRMRFDEFEERVLQDTTLQRLVQKWIRYQALTLTQVAACNGLHKTEERLARWLLMVHDRLDQQLMPLTQEMLGQMLGTRRATVTLAAAQLQADGLIDGQRGHIGIKSRAGLERASCECYSVLRRLHQDLL